jgi:hypothetical protein
MGLVCVTLARIRTSDEMVAQVDRFDQVSFDKLLNWASVRVGESVSRSNFNTRSAGR